MMSCFRTVPSFDDRLPAPFLRLLARGGLPVPLGARAAQEVLRPLLIPGDFALPEPAGWSGDWGELHLVADDEGTGLVRYLHVVVTWGDDVGQDALLRTPGLLVWTWVAAGR